MVKKVKTIDEKIEELAVITQRGFTDVDKKLEVLSSDLKEVKETVDRIEYRVNTHDRRIENLEDKVRVISTKIGLQKA